PRPARAGGRRPRTRRRSGWTAAETRRPGLDRLGQDVQGGQDRRRQELLRRAVVGPDEGKRGVLEIAQSLSHCELLNGGGQFWRPPFFKHPFTIPLHSY